LKYTELSKNLTKLPSGYNIAKVHKNVLILEIEIPIIALVTKTCEI